MDTAAKWYLRKHDDADVFGPMHFTKLKDWACSAQVSPLDQVSDDGVNWVKAPMVAELHMDYLLQLESDSYYGPTTRETVQEFLRLGEIGPETIIINCCSGTQKTLRDSGMFQTDLPAMEEISEREPSRRSIRHNLQQRIRELELLLVEKRQQLEMAEMRIRQLEKRLEAAGG